MPLDGLVGRRLIIVREMQLLKDVLEEIDSIIIDTLGEEGFFRCCLEESRLLHSMHEEKPPINKEFAMSLDDLVTQYQLLEADRNDIQKRISAIEIAIASEIEKLGLYLCYSEYDSDENLRYQRISPECDR
ncbi:MAG: hypothetical protein SVY53_12025 [Chloroflexota bacterium]|nr:hypothetical protein [Chloroflexota bacterium]